MEAESCANFSQNSKFQSDESSSMFGISWLGLDRDHIEHKATHCPDLDGDEFGLLDKADRY